MAHLNEIILPIINSLHPDVYLELGIQFNQTISKVKAKRKIGVDLKRPTNCNYEFHHMSTNEYFRKLDIPDIDVCFIDADHAFEQVLEDYNNVLPYIKKDGLILLHDTFPTAERHKRLSLCGTAYKILDHIKEEHVTIPIFPGLTIVRKT